MSLYPGEFIHHRDDLMVDYLFFGEAFGWEPESVDKLNWSLRKEMKEIYIEEMKRRNEEIKNQR